jgi:hypothetical protein
MALIERFWVVADHDPVKAGEEIIEGMLVKQDSNGDIVLATGASGENCLGVAADTKSTSTAGLPTTNASNQGAFVNRLSDSFDETKASGRMTVYHSGGAFASNQYESGSYSIGDALYVSSNGKLTNTPSTSTQVVGRVVKVPGAYDSGVPGIDVNGSLTLGDYLEFKLVI